mmetsp:Transcript_126866/g.364892  ORF Transcript_126866/g.364892 Transcript_126866/m.364892 type:complete len:228 (-) Transcript_126866:131-814(-)
MHAPGRQDAEARALLEKRGHLRLRFLLVLAPLRLEVFRDFVDCIVHMVPLPCDQRHGKHPAEIAFTQRVGDLPHESKMPLASQRLQPSLLGACVDLGVERRCCGGRPPEREACDADPRRHIVHASHLLQRVQPHHGLGLLLPHRDQPEPIVHDPSQQIIAFGHRAEKDRGGDLLLPLREVLPELRLVFAFGLLDARLHLLPRLLDLPVSSKVLCLGPPSAKDRAEGR